MFCTGSAAESLIAGLAPDFNPLLLSDDQLVDAVLTAVDKLTASNESTRCSVVAIGRSAPSIFHTSSRGSGSSSPLIKQRLLRALRAEGGLLHHPDNNTDDDDIIMPHKNPNNTSRTSGASSTEVEQEKDGAQKDEIHKTA